MSWPLVKLGDLFKVTSGGTPSRKKSEYYDGGDIHWVKTGDLHNKYVRSASEFITQEGLDGSSARLYPKGTVLVAMYGATIGACSILDIEAATNQACAAFTPSEKVDPVFLYYLLKHSKPAFVKAGSGGAQPNISGTFLKNFEIPLPPLDEQKRIAAILDKADAIRQKRKQAIDLADEFLRSVFLDMFGDPVTNPKGWDKKQLKSLLSSIDSGKSPKCDGLPANVGEWGVLKLSAVTSGQYLAQENKAMLSKSDVDERFEVVAGDVLFTRKNTRDLVAAVAYVFETEPRKLMPDLIFRLNIKDKCELEPLYLFSLLANKSQRSDIQQLAGGAAGSMPNISKAKLLEVEVPVPPIVLQRRFAEVVSKTRKIHQQNTESQSNSFLFFNSLSQKAFSGQL
ncbi:restriction endonuclease subunit S [Vibrio sp. Vb2880]|uniref:restriction endonuclease subunit S n=1 Tax=Vibrio sp. Vb2880 TaxID=2816076 RepID=UPI002964AB2E|nr:restriction endonuclease subunit S [Vibrio sp. Vb2880]MDW1576516.1 restriction endonuclease subunit S [Vibrio sp. Vb2880]